LLQRLIFGSVKYGTFLLGLTVGCLLLSRADIFVPLRCQHRTYLQQCAVPYERGALGVLDPAAN